MITITNQDDLVKFFDAFRGQTRAKIVTRTPVTMRKKDVATKSIENPFTAIFKVQTIEVELNADYQGKVNNQRVIESKDTDFTAEELKWGKAINGSIVKKDRNLYLKTILVGNIGSPKYELPRGELIDVREFAAFLPVNNGSPKQDLVDEVRVRTFNLDNVIGINIENKVRFVN